jgi:catechol 2,3-dioxygenase
MEWTGAPAGTTMGHVHLHVGDLDGARRFYHAALGLDLTVTGYPGALFLSAGGYHHHLGVNTWSPGPAATDDQARLLDWELVLPDETGAAAAAQSLQAAGRGASHDAGEWTAVDPWGTRLRIRTP